MNKKPYSDARWRDNPMPRTPYCGYCKHFIGLVDGHLSCKAFDKIPRDIMRSMTNPLREIVESGLSPKTRTMCQNWSPAKNLCPTTDNGQRNTLKTPLKGCFYYAKIKKGGIYNGRDHNHHQHGG